MLRCEATRETYVHTHLLLLTAWGDTRQYYIHSHSFVVCTYRNNVFVALCCNVLKHVTEELTVFILYLLA